VLIVGFSVKEMYIVVVLYKVAKGGCRDDHRPC